MNEEDISEDFSDEEEITDADYGFIIGPDGELKSMFLPDDPMQPTPDTVMTILKMFGIDDSDFMDNTTIQ
jgi:hypothetical protein